ncbi:MAG: DUF1566 domain-containing protein [Gammaproteobacteria bacterium]
MLKVNLPLKITLLTLSYLFLLSACGGGGGGGAIPDKDKTPPVISSKSPNAREIDVDIFQPITITFNESIDTVTENNVVLLKYQTPNPNNFNDGTAQLLINERVSVAVSVEGNKLIIRPSTNDPIKFNYLSETRYRLTLIGIKDSNKNPMSDVSWEFSTTTIPTLTGIQPGLNETVSRVTDIVVSFSEEMDKTSIESGFSIEEIGSTIPAPSLILNYDQVTYTATYSLPTATYLNANSNYLVTITQAKDLKGNKFVSDITTKFGTNMSTTTDVLPTQPKNVIAVPHDRSVDISWTAAPNIAGITQPITYIVYVSVDNGSSYSPITTSAPLTGTSFTHSKLKNTQTYQYAVTANAGGQQSLKVFSSGAVTPLGVLSFPTAEKVTAIAGNKIVNLSWLKITSAVSYNLYVKVNNIGNFTKLNADPIAGNAFEHNANSTLLTSPSLVVVNDNSYIYRVSAINQNGDEGPQTSVGSDVATPLGIPLITNFTVSKSPISDGQSMTLTASFLNGIGTIRNNIDATEIFAGNTNSTNKTFTTPDLFPKVTTIYTLTVAQTGKTSATKKVSVTVNANPVIVSFTAGNHSTVRFQKINVIADFNNGTGTLTATPINGNSYSIGAITANVARIVSFEVTTKLDLTVTNGFTQQTAVLTINVSQATVNDTGVVNCVNFSTEFTTCPQVGFPDQDGEFGRDVSNPNNSNGFSGFSFTLLDSSGNPMLNKNKGLVGYSTTPWSCVQDTITGLMWETKTDSGLQSSFYTYSWYNSNTLNNGGDAGTPNGGICFDTVNCDTEKYVAEINRISLCGYSDWRLPNLEEMRSIVNYKDDFALIMIDRDFFVNTRSSVLYWTSSTVYATGFMAGNYASVYSTFNGVFGIDKKNQINHIRLVRGRQ